SAFRPSRGSAQLSVLKQGQRNLGRRIGLRQHGRRRLLKDLGAGQVCRFRGKVGYRDGAFRRRHVLVSHVQAVDRGTEGEGLEGTQAAAKAGNLSNRVADNVLSTAQIGGTERIGSTAAQRVEEADARVSKAAGRDRLNANAGLVGFVDGCTQREGGSAAGDTERLALAGIEASREGEVHIEVVVAIGDVQTAGLSRSTIDLHSSILAVSLATGTAGDGERSAEGSDADIVLRAVAAGDERQVGAVRRSSYASRGLDRIDGGNDRRKRRAAGKAQLLGTGRTGNLQRNGATANVILTRGSRAGEGQLALGGAVGDLHDNRLGGVVRKVGGVDLQSREGAGGHAAVGVVEVTVQKVLAAEASGASDAVDGAQDRVNLKLVSSDLVGAEGSGVGRLIDQPVELVQQAADFSQATFGGSDDVGRLVGVVDGLIDTGF